MNITYVPIVVCLFFCPFRGIYDTGNLLFVVSKNPANGSWVWFVLFFLREPVFAGLGGEPTINMTLGLWVGLPLGKGI